MWSGVIARFRGFHENLCPTPSQIQEGTNHHEGVRKSLNTYYYRSHSSTANSFLTGSWGKRTRIRPPRDVDIYFVLPDGVYWKFNSYQGNRQSALLQAVKNVLQRTYPNTKLRGDGQVVVVEFSRINVEVVPAFLYNGNQYLICDTHAGGCYKIADPKAEMKHMLTIHRKSSMHLRPIIMMLKSWQAHCKVPVKSFYLELLACEFMPNYSWKNIGYVYYDWIFRDFFEYMYSRANGQLIVPGTSELLHMGNAWLSQVATAYRGARMACDYERNDNIVRAGEEWQKIFGPQVPRIV